MQFVESTGIDPGQDLLQIFAGPEEFKFCETGEDRACRRRRRSAFRGRAILKMKVGLFNAEAGGHRLGWNVSGRINVIIVKFDE